MATSTTAGRNGSVVDEEKGLTRTTTGVTMSPELFEKVREVLRPLYWNVYSVFNSALTDRAQLYLTPKVPHVGDYNKRFANPTALGFVG